jgi:cyclopropane-fatty-acyl-phospholipid synthase
MNTVSKVLNDYGEINFWGFLNVQKTVQRLCRLADIKTGGDRPWDIQVRDPRLYTRVLTGGSLALGESYVDGWWDSSAVDQFIYKILLADMDKKFSGLSILMDSIKAKIFNMQSRKRAFEVGERHYDIGNELYRAMLDKRMVYSCGYWENAKDLNEAQEAKLDLICSKIGLKPGQQVLDIGCGWGGFAKYAAEKYHVNVCGITISKEQEKIAKGTCCGLPVEIRLQDYRDLNEEYDNIVSIGMFEHVGYKNYREYMNVVDRCLKRDGLFLLHTIGGNTSVNSVESWTNKYIFPNGTIPSAKQITSAAEGLFVIEDWQNIGINYDKTLMAWYDNFRNNWDKISHCYDKRFYRMWTYYLLNSAASFRARKNHVWQIVFSKKGFLKGYKRRYQDERVNKMGSIQGDVGYQRLF